MNDENKIIDSLKKQLEKSSYTYDNESGFGVVFKEDYTLRNGEKESVYQVSYHTPAFIDEENFIESKIYFAIMEQDSLELLYIMTPHGYIEKRDNS